MAEKNLSNLPDAIKKRDILFGVAKLSPEALKSMAENFEKNAWFSDAMDFYQQVKDKDALKRIRQLSIPEGDTFLFLKASRLLDETPESELLECSKRAEALGKLRYALRGYERLESNAEAQAAVARIRAQIAQDPDIVAEAAAQVFIPASEEEFIEDDSKT